MTSIVVMAPEELAGIVERAVRAALRDTPPPSAPLVTVAEAARQLGVTTRTVHRRIKDGSLRAVHVGRSVRLDPRSIAGPDEAAVARLAVEARRGSR